MSDSVQGGAAPSQPGQKTGETGANHEAATGSSLTPTADGGKEKVPLSTAPPHAVQEIIKRLPPREREIVEQSFSMLVQAPMVNPVLAKLDGQHLHKILDGAENDSKRHHEDRDKNRRHNRFVVVVGLVGFLAISALFLYLNQAELLKGILMGFAVFAGGLGFGARFLRRGDEEED